MFMLLTLVFSALLHASSCRNNICLRHTVQ